MSPRARLSLAALAVVAAGVALYTLRPAIPQWPGYHGLADRRTLLGIPNALDVLSNLPFAIVGLLGLRAVMRRARGPAGSHGVEWPEKAPHGASPRGADAPRLAADPWLRRPYAVFFAGALLTAFGSAWYHLEPGNARLVWDRLPMTVAFMGLLAALLAEYGDARLARRLLVPLVAAGLWSVAHWRLTELRGAGDLRPYGIVQYGSMLFIAVLVLLSPPQPGGRLLAAAFGSYALAKLLEVADGPIFALGGVVSGHTLKHLAAGAGVAFVLLRLRADASARGRDAGPSA